MAALVLSIGVAMGLASPAPAAPPAAAAAEALARGDARHSEFDYDAARREYEQAVALEPGGYDARARLAHVLNDLGGERPAAARPLFEEALRLSDALVRDAPERAEGHYWRAASLANLMTFRSGPEKVKASREIEAAALRATELDPCLAPAYAALAITYRELAGVGGLVRALASAALGGLPRGSMEDAEGLLRAAVALDPRDPFARYELARTLETRGRREEAIAELERSLGLPDREARDRRNRVEATARLARLRAAGTANGAGERRARRGVEDP